MNETIQKAGQIIQKNSAHFSPEGADSYCVLALMDQDGYPTASTLTASKADGIAELFFCTGLSANKAQRIQRCGRASVCFSGPDYNITLVGDIEVLTDPEAKKAQWYDGMGRHFSGPEDPQYCVLRFRTKRYNLFVDWTEAAGTL